MESGLLSGIVKLQRRTEEDCSLSGCLWRGSCKGRVKNIMNYKKPAVWIVLLAIAAFAVVSVCFATTKKNDDNVEYNFTCDYGSSKLYSKEDMDEAIQTIMNEFNNWKGCECTASDTDRIRRAARATI